MKTNPLVLTLDFGTQSLRVSLVDKKGNIVAINKNTYEKPYETNKPGYAEQDPNYYFNKAIESIKKLTSKNKNRLDDIIGATITTFRDSSVQLDKDYKPLRNCILWLDQRTTKVKEKLPIFLRFLFKLVGMKNTITLNRSRTMAHYLKQNEPEVWSKTFKYVNISAYLTYKFAGNLCDSVSSVTGHYPLNFKKRKWYKDKAMKGRIFGIPASMLCELKMPGEELGTISDEVAKLTGLPKGIKMIATGSDKACETVGLYALNNQIGAISYGTASTIEVSNRKYHNPEPFLPAYPAAVNGFYNMEVQVYRGYWMLTWFAQQFAIDLFDEAKIQKFTIEEIFNSKISHIPPGSEGLILQPYWGPGLSRPLSRGAVIGFTDTHTREHLYRAIIEGIAYALREGLESIEKHQHKKIKELRISGGGSQSDVICQITADVFGLPVYRVQTYETTTLGAAIATFIALKEFKSIEEACESMSHKTDSFIPNPVAHQQYQYLYKKVYLKLYPRLKESYRRIKLFDENK